MRVATQHRGPYADLADIFRAALERVDPYRMIKERLSLQANTLLVTTEHNTFRLKLSPFREILLIGAGKATAPMARAVEELLGERLSAGLIVVKYGHTENLRITKTIEAGHPVPDDNSLLAGAALATLCRQAGRQTLVINLLSGGGSALLASPYEPVDKQCPAPSLTDLRLATQALLACGADITELNCIRKHLSGIKGGRLAEILYPATCLSLILSDVVGNNLSAIASGPTVPDSSTYGMALEIIERYKLADRLPPAVSTLLTAGAAGNLPETPKPGAALFRQVTNLLIGSNHQALLAAGERARALGYHTLVLTSSLTGEASQAARFYAALARDLALHQLICKRPACLIGGGETTVTVTGSGRGGRNQEMALAFLREMAQAPREFKEVYFLSAATDGNDGPTPAAGAFAGEKVLQQTSALGLSIRDYLANNDAYHFFRQTGCLYTTGPTNTNVCDIQLTIVK